MFNIGDKVEIVNVISPSEEMKYELKKCIGEKGKITHIYDNNMFEFTWYEIDRIPYTWKEEELQLIEDNISMTEKEILNCFRSS